MIEENRIRCHRACPVCGSKEVFKLHAMEFSLPEMSPLPSQYSIVSCVDCGFIYANTSGKAADYAQYYENFSKYEDINIATGGGGQVFDKFRIDITVNWIAQHVPSNSRVLDVGSGNGGMLQALNNIGFADLTGSDSSFKCIDRIKELGFKGWQGDVLSDDFYNKSEGKFDLIILSHVLEHLVEPLDAVVRLSRLLSKVGRLYIETPDSSRYINYSSVPFYYFDTEHINHFDKFSLENICSQASLAVSVYGDKELLLYDGIEYPATYVLAKRAMEEGALVKPNFQSLYSIKQYIEQSITTNELPEVISNAILEERPVALWGAGSHSQRLMQNNLMKNANIIAVVDRDRGKRGVSFLSCIVESPEVGLSGLPKNCLLIIAAALVATKISQEYIKMDMPYDYVIA